MPDRTERESAAAMEQPLIQSKEQLLTSEARLRREVAQLQHLIDALADSDRADLLLRAIREYSTRLAAIEIQLAQVSHPKSTPGLIIEKGTGAKSDVRGEDTTHLAVKVHLMMAQVPTSICHLLSREEYPLIKVGVENTGWERKRRVRISAEVAQYSAECVSTIEVAVGQKDEVTLLPTFLPERLRTVTELTRATLSVRIDDLDTKLIELHESRPLWLLARNSAPIRIKQPTTGEFKDMLPFLAAFVTPHEPSILEFLGVVAARHPQQCLEGYLATLHGSPVISQVRAAYDALKLDTGITYVSSFIDFNPDGESKSQRVRLPRESLATKQANCLDGAVLFASLLEAMSLQPALVYVPGHAIVAWRNTGVSDRWTFLDTTKIGLCSFDEAIEWGAIVKEQFNVKPKYEEGSLDSWRFLPIDEMRSKYGITPLQ